MYQIVHKNVHCRDSILNSDFAPELAHRQLDPEGKQPLNQFPINYAIRVKSSLYRQFIILVGPLISKPHG